MAERVINISSMSLSSLDSGLTLAKSESLLQKREKQEVELRKKDEKIKELEEMIANIQETSSEYQKELEERRQRQEQPQTLWVKNVIAENEELKEYLRSAEVENKNLTQGYESMMEELENKSKEIELLEKRMEELQCEKKADNVWEEMVTNIMVDANEKGEEYNIMKNEVKKMKNLFNKICTNLKIEEKLKDDNFQGSAKMKREKFDEVLGIVDIEIWRLTEEREMLRKDKKELRDLVKVLEFEKKTRDDKENDVEIERKNLALEAKEEEVEKERKNLALEAKEDDVEIERNNLALEDIEEEVEIEGNNLALEDIEEEVEIEGNNLALEEKMKKLTEENKRQESEIQYWSNCCAQLFKRVKQSAKDIIQLKERNNNVGKLAKKEVLRRAKRRKKLRAFKNRLRISESNVALERRLKNVLLSRNLELRASIECLEASIECLTDDLTTYDQSLKTGILESVEASLVFEQNKDLENDVEMLRNQLIKREKEVARLKIEDCLLKKKCDELKGDIEGGKRTREMLQEKFDFLSNQKDHIEKQFADERRSFEDLWAELNKENNKLENQLANGRKCLDKIKAELGQEVEKRGLVERELKHIETEKDKITEQSASEKKRMTSFEKELAESSRQLEQYKKAKLSRFQRFRRYFSRQRT